MIMEILPDVIEVEGEDDQIHEGVGYEKENARNRKNSFEYNTINVCGEFKTEKFIWIWSFKYKMMYLHIMFKIMKSNVLKQNYFDSKVEETGSSDLTIWIIWNKISLTSYLSLIWVDSLSSRF